MYPDITIIGDVYLGGADMSNFALYGRNLAKSATGGTNPSGGTWNVNNYTMNPEAQSYLATGSDSQAYLYSRLNVLGHEAVSVTTDSSGLGATNWYLQTNKNNIIDLPDSDAEMNYPEGRIWQVGYQEDYCDHTSTGVGCYRVIRGSTHRFHGLGTIVFDGPAGQPTGHGGLDIPANSTILAASDGKSLGIAVAGDIKIGDGCKINAAIFATGRIMIGNNVQLTGSFVASDFTNLNGGSLSGSYGIRISYDYELENNWPPGFRYFDMPMAENVAPGQ